MPIEEDNYTNNRRVNIYQDDLGHEDNFLILVQFLIVYLDELLTDFSYTLLSLAVI